MPQEPVDANKGASTLEELLAWTRAMAIPTVSATLKNALTTSDERHVFELSDGHHTTREIAAEVGVGNATVSRWWKKWRALGICVAGDSGRTRHLIRLEDLGIPVTPSSTAEDVR